LGRKLLRLSGELLRPLLRQHWLRSKLLLLSSLRLRLLWEWRLGGRNSERWIEWQLRRWRRTRHIDGWLRAR
jgi:hypothetical protein